MPYQYAPWLFLVPVMLIALIIIGYLIWFEFTDTSPTFFWQVLTDPEGASQDLAAAQRIDTLPDQENNPLAVNKVLAQLDADAHTQAFFAWCGSQNWNYSSKFQECIAPDAAACEARSIKKLDYKKYDVVNKPFLKFNDGQCFTTPGLGNFCSINQIPYLPANVSCDTNNICSAVNQPLCVINEAYCKSMGVSFNGKDDCFVPAGQQVAELLFGETVYRKYKTSIQDLQNTCNTDGPESDKCIESVLYVIFLPQRIIFDTVKVDEKKAYDDFKNKCLVKQQTAAIRIGECIDTVFEFSPIAFLALKLISTLLTVVKLAWPHVKHYAHEAFLAIQSLGIPALNAVGQLANDAGRSLWNAGKQAFTSLEDITGLHFGNTLSDVPWDFAGQAIFAAAALVFSPLIAIGDAAAKALTNLGNEITERAEILNKALDAGGSAMGTFISTIVIFGIAALEVIGDQLVKFFGEAASFFAKLLDFSPNPKVSSVGNKMQDSIAASNVTTQCLGVHC